MRAWGVIMIFTGFMILGLTVAASKNEKETLGEDNNDNTLA